MALNGDATLVFVIDTTGSMGVEIESAKQIASEIINAPRNKGIAIDYILSPFNDNEGMNL